MSSPLANAVRWFLSLLLGAVFALLPAADLAWRCVVACARGARSPLRSPREARFPARLGDARLGTHCWATVNGLRMHYVERGPSHGAPPPIGSASASTPGSAPPVAPGADAAAPVLLLLHGFPEMWYSWRWFLLAFSSHYRVVAPDLRGFGDTSRGEASWRRAHESRLAVLVADVHALVEALGGSRRVVLCGHDWGAVVAYGECAGAVRRRRQASESTNRPRPPTDRSTDRQTHRPTDRPTSLPPPPPQFSSLPAPRQPTPTRTPRACLAS